MSQANGHGEINLDELLQQEVYVRYKGKRYVLREPTEDATIRVQRLYMQGAKVIDGKVNASVDRVAEAQATLVSLCLFDCETDKTVPLQTLYGWESSVVKFLFRKVDAMLKARGEGGGAGGEEERLGESPGPREATSSRPES
jgi:hypothetical protein